MESCDLYFTYFMMKRSRRREDVRDEDNDDINTHHKQEDIWP